MALIVFLRGVNVGGHKIFRPTVLVKQLKRFDLVNIGAAGNFIIRKPITQSQLRIELKRRLPFDSEIIICSDREIYQMLSQNPFGRIPERKKIVRFVSILSRRSRSIPLLPISFPFKGKWLLKIIAIKGRFVFGQYRRHMGVIKYFGMLDRLFEVPLTTRNWNTITVIAKILTVRGTD